MNEVHYANRITTKDTFTVVTDSSFLHQVVICVKNAGTSWALAIQDKASTARVRIWIPTIALPTDNKPYQVFYDKPIRMDNGIDIVTSGTTAGELTVDLAFRKSEGS